MRKGTLWKEKLLEGLSWKKLIFILLGAAIATFGIHNIHQQVGITEGGVIGAMLLVEHWLGFSPAYITPVLDVACYLLAWKYLGGQFIKISILSTAGVSLFYKLWEQFPPMLPDLSGHNEEDQRIFSALAIFTRRLVPSLDAPSSINFSASAKELIPPAALIRTPFPTWRRKSSTSAKVAPSVENPVEVLI